MTSTEVTTAEKVLRIHVARLHGRHPELPVETCIALCVEQIRRDRAALARAPEQTPEAAAAIIRRGLVRIERLAKRQNPPARIA